MTTTDPRPHAAPPINPRRLPELAAELAARRDRWPSEIRFDPQRRWYGRVSADGDVNAWLLTWLPGQSTGLHDHGDAAGAFAVVDGVLHESAVTLSPNRGLRDVTRAFKAGQVRPFGSWHVHDMVNRGPLPAISLHVYSPALTIMRRYRRYGDRLVQVSVQLAGEDW